MKHIIGIDIGGTKISIVIGTNQGRIIDSYKIKTKHKKKVFESINEIIDTVKTIIEHNKIKRKDILGIGVGIPGPVGEKIGIIQDAPNLEGWNGINIKRILESKFKMPVFCNNDANSACIAEKLFGNGMKVKNLIYITISTGIGSGIIIDGKIVMGADNNAGEFGHITVEPNGPKCKCGKRGCLEALSSGTAIANAAYDLLKKPHIIKYYKNEYAYKRYLTISKGKFKLPLKSNLLQYSGKREKDIRAEDILKCAKKGDQLSRYIYWRAGYYFGVGVATLIQLINPQMICYGGSVVDAGSLYFRPMRLALKEHSWSKPLKSCRIVKAKLGKDVADVGSISLVLFH